MLSLPAPRPVRPPLRASRATLGASVSPPASPEPLPKPAPPPSPAAAQQRSPRSSPPLSPQGSPPPSPPLSPFAARPTSPMYDDARRRRRGMVHGDNTAGALRYAPSLHSDLLHLSGPPAAAAPAGPAALPASPVSAALPVHLLPMLTSLPGLVGNLRRAQRGMAWWRSFGARKAHLDADCRALASPALVVRHAALAQLRASRAHERRGVVLALREATFNLGFNLLELSSYAAGLLPPALRRLARGRALRLGHGCSQALPYLLLGSGLLHVLQRTHALWQAWRAAHAVARAEALPPALAKALRADCAAELCFQALQLGCWLGFAVGLGAAANLGPGLSPLLGGTLAVFSMVGARLQRLWCRQRFDVPDSSIWHVDAQADRLPSLQRLRAFGPPAVQGVALASLKAQRRRLQRLEAEVLRCHAGGVRAAALRLLLGCSHLPGVAPLLGVAAGRWLTADPQALARTLLSGYRDVWALQLAQVRREAKLLPGAVPGAAALHGPRALGPQLRDWEAEAAHARGALTYEATRLTHVLAGADRWLAGQAHPADEVYAVLADCWQLQRGAGGGAACRAPRLGALLLAARSHVDDALRSLLWASKLGCVQRAET